MKHKYTIPYYHFQLDFTEQQTDFYTFAHRVINLQLQDNDLIYNTIYSITDNILLEYQQHLEFYIKLLMKIFNSNENIFIDFFNNFVNENTKFYKQYSDEYFFTLFLKLYNNNDFYELFSKHFEKLQLIKLIEDFVLMRKNISNF